MLSMNKYVRDNSLAILALLTMVRGLLLQYGGMQISGAILWCAAAIFFVGHEIRQRGK